jgi:hypothetical protein
MKKSLFALAAFGFSAMASSSCLTSACEPNERASYECVTSNNLCTVGILKDDCSPAIASCGHCAVYKDEQGTTRYRKSGACGGDVECGVAWADLRDMSKFEDASLDNCACANSQCTSICAPVCA